MKISRRLAVGLLVASGAAGPALAHSLKELENQLHGREKYFQPLERSAPPFSLRDADGRTVSLSGLREQVVVLHFIYASCLDVCPLHAEKIAEVQRLVNVTPMRDQVRFITITTDPERDTADVMREYGPAHGLDAANWTFLTSGPERPEETRQLAKEFGHTFTPTEEGMQMHGIVTHVVDREGRLRANFHGLKFEPTNLVVFVNALVNDVHKPGAARNRGFWERVKSLF